jgi:hypothetical protein
LLALICLLQCGLSAGIVQRGDLDGDTDRHLTGFDRPNEPLFAPFQQAGNPRTYARDNPVFPAI